MNRAELLAELKRLKVKHDPSKMRLGQEEIDLFERLLKRGGEVSPLLIERLQGVHDSGNLERLDGTRNELADIIKAARGK